MSFEDIPEDREESFPCACGGNIAETTGGEWQCDACDWTPPDQSGEAAGG